MKERRLQKSRENNPLWSGNKNKRKGEDIEKEASRATRAKIRKSNDSNEMPYSGIISKLGQNKLRSNFNLKSQAELHMQAIKKQRKLNKASKQLNIAKKEKMKKKQDNMPVRYIPNIFYRILYFNFSKSNYIEFINLHFFFNTSNVIFFLAETNKEI